MDKFDGSLRFVEAKHYTNSELWDSNNKPKVIGQVDKYQKIIKREENEIVLAYNSFLNCFSGIIGFQFTKIQSIDKLPVSLWIFGFDANQRDGRLKNKLLPSLSNAGIKKYAIGNPKNAIAQTLWECSK